MLIQIFIGNLSVERRGWDSNPRALADKRFSRPPRYDHFDISPCERLALGVLRFCLAQRKDYSSKNNSNCQQLFTHFFNIFFISQKMPILCGFPGCQFFRLTWFPLYYRLNFFKFLTSLTILFLSILTMLLSMYRCPQFTVHSVHSKTLRDATLAGQTSRNMICEQ